MQWLIQNSGFTFEALDRNLVPLVAALDRQGIKKSAVGIVPFTDIITGLEDVDRDEPTIFYGSTRLAELGMTAGFSPGVFYHPDWFNPIHWVGKRPDMLNEPREITVGELKRDWVPEAIFIKSADPKVLTGQVIEVEEKTDWISEHDHLKDETVLVTSTPRIIDQEWRFWISCGEVVAGSQRLHRSPK